MNSKCYQIDEKYSNFLKCKVKVYSSSPLTLSQKYTNFLIQLGFIIQLLYQDSISIFKYVKFKINCIRQSYRFVPSRFDLWMKLSFASAQ